MEEELTDLQKIDLLCGCVNTLMDDMHPQFKTMIRDMEAIGQEEATAKFTQYLEDNPEEMEQIMKDTQKLDNFDGSMAEIEGCENLNAVLSNTMKNEGSMTLEELEAELKSRAECEFAAIFFSMGKKQE